MKFQVNNSPELSMNEITKQLFNNKLLSDIRFSIDGKIIYAHSLELMKRSVVFQEQLEANLGDHKIIKITDCNYECFFEFLKFIYTDDCDFDGDAIGLLKLSVIYKVIKLENQLIPILCNRGRSANLALFEFCVTNNYQLPYNRIRSLVALHLENCLETERFKTLHRDAVEEILKIDRVSIRTTEVQIFKGLVRWINHQGEQNGIAKQQRREYFDNLIRLIRFPAMSTQEVFDCTAKNRELFAENDFALLFKQFAFKAESGDQTWIAEPRKEFSSLFVKREFAKDETFQTKFIIVEDMILSGITYGLDFHQDTHEIIISSKSPGQNESDSVVCTVERKVDLSLSTKSINFGDSIILKSNTQYTIEFKYFGRGPFDMPCLGVVCRPDYSDIIMNYPFSGIKLIEAGPNVFEIFFKPITISKTSIE